MSNNSNIEEIPLDAEAPEVEVREDNSEPVEENIPETAQPVEENNQAKRGRGRPKGSLNKPKPPPKPKPVAKPSVSIKGALEQVVKTLQECIKSL